MKDIRIASRGSRLALVQSEYVGNLLKDLSPDVRISIVKVSTKGDRDRSDFLYKSESVGFFTTEVESALLDGRADVAVHSFKDLPTEQRVGLIVGAVPKRESVCDVLVASGQVGSVADLAKGAVVGTSSLRRIAQLKHARGDLKCVPLRGNVETRVGKVAAGDVDAIVRAEAGLRRLGLTDKISAVLRADEFIPAPAQGALAIQIRDENTELEKLVSRLDDKASRITAQTERYVLSTLRGGCSIPLGVWCQIQNDTMNIYAVISDVEGNKFIRRQVSCPVGEAKGCAEKLAEELLSAGGKEILEEIRKQDR